MTPEEEQAAKSSVEKALFGTLVEPSAADLAAFAAEAQIQAEMSVALEGDVITVESDDQIGKPTLQGD